MNHLLASLPIKGSGYEEFITTLTQIAYAACEEGAEQMQAAGKSPKDLQDDEDARRQFIAACHRGFARAQSAIGGLVIDLDAAIRAARAELSAAKRNRDKDKAKELHSRIESDAPWIAHTLLCCRAERGRLNAEIVWAEIGRGG